MNFQNVENEIKKYSDFFKNSQSTLLKFIKILDIIVNFLN